MIIKNGSKVKKVYKGKAIIGPMYYGELLIKNGTPSYYYTIAENSNMDISDVKLAMESKPILETYAQSDVNDFLLKKVDNEIYVRIMHHYINNGAFMFTSSNCSENYNSNLYSILKYIPNIGKFDSYYWFYGESYPTMGSTSVTIRRWKQTSDPTTTSSVSGYTNISNATRGLCKCSGNTYLAHTNSTGDWWGATGCYTVYDGGIPGLGNQGVKNTYNLYMRIL